MRQVFEFLAASPVLVLFLLIGIGAAVGRIRVAGISLGAVAVLFAAMGITAWGVTQDVLIEIPPPVGDTGLVLFAFCVGLVSGAGFFNALKTAWPLMLVVTGILIVGAGAAYGIGTMLGMDAVTIAGTFAGAVTNTPALAATGGSADATVGYASSYIFGVIGALLATGLALRHRRDDTDAPVRIVDKAVRVEKGHAHRAGELAAEHGVTFSRVRPKGGGDMDTVGPDSELPEGAVVNVVGPADEVDEVVHELGHTSTLDIVSDRTKLDYRRIILSNTRLAGRTIGSLGLRERFGASIVRVRRGDVEFVGTGDFVLQEGDRMRVVGPRDVMAELTTYLGDSERGLADINPVALGLGIAVGLAIGAIQIPLPGGSHFALGAAAGALIMGLVMGRVRRVGKIVTTLPNTAANVLSELGLTIFLAYAGTKAGSLIISAIASGAVLSLAAVGAVVTCIAMFGTYLVVRHVFHAGGTRSAGLIAGAQTNPAILAFANGRTDYDVRVALGYSLVYPAAMVAKILLAQVLVTF